MDAVDLIGLLPPFTYAVFAVTERLWPARPFPPRKRWQLVGIAFLALIATLGTAVPLLIPADWLARHRLIDGTPLGVAGGTLVGFVVLELAMYAWHRTAHKALGTAPATTHTAPGTSYDVGRSGAGSNA